jgi:3',5'-nucleoside bisphosphate phosphatase
MVQANNTIRVDLHCHSSLSDGDYSPERIAKEMAAAGVCFAALTDHDTIRGQERFRLALQTRGIRYISGAELQVQSDEGVLHLLAYGFNTRDRTFHRTLRKLRSPLLAFAHDWKERFHTFMTSRINGDFPAPIADLPALHPDGLLGVEEAIALIHDAGGCAFLAHPFTGIGDPDRLEGILAGLRPLGLDGIEAFYKPYTEEARQMLVEAAERHSLLVSAGSDYHGPHMPNAVNPGLEVPQGHWLRFLEAVSKI